MMRRVIVVSRRSELADDATRSRRSRIMTPVPKVDANRRHARLIKIPRPAMIAKPVVEARSDFIIINTLVWLASKYIWFPVIP